MSGWMRNSLVIRTDPFSLTPDSRSIWLVTLGTSRVPISAAMRLRVFARQPMTDESPSLENRRPNRYFLGQVLCGNHYGHLRLAGLEQEVDDLTGLP